MATRECEPGKAGQGQPKHVRHRGPQTAYECESEITDWIFCSKRFRDTKKGNYVHYRVKGTTVNIFKVRGDYCDPKLIDCTCKSLFKRALDQALHKTPAINRIRLVLAANPWEYGCRCYMGVAARAGFKYVKLLSNRRKCNEKKRNKHVLVS